jgi:hypothetical protein
MANYCSGGDRKLVSPTTMIPPAELVEISVADEERVAADNLILRS